MGTEDSAKKDQGTQEENQQKPQDYEKTISDLKAQIEALTKELEALKQKPEDTQKEESELEKTIAELQKQVEEYKSFKERYEEERIRNTILSLARDSVDPEAVYELLKDKAQLNEKGEVLVDDRPAEEAVKELLEKRTYLKKAPPKTGSGAGEPSSKQTENLTYEDLLKDPQKLLEVKRNSPELFEKLKAEYYEKKLRR